MICRHIATSHSTEGNVQGGLNELLMKHSICLCLLRQCQQFQKNENLEEYTGVVVLDEIGLAEDSAKMPLKTLHPLLEDGCINDEIFEPYKKVWLGKIYMRIKLSRAIMLHWFGFVMFKCIKNIYINTNLRNTNLCVFRFHLWAYLTGRWILQK